ncbi:hypothetical protein AK812_SmicGene15394 [Symbiodinium microadriaticum]|uniref:Uncharacterized protein n=1 Tax=Symbiodinium microadriaticum TaxID=2951 RepID=A0A1Q9E327_SYMMI|nr:hypothetical protein AK812_SmicGene15394 [Symbiodinium microadriaticum]
MAAPALPGPIFADAVVNVDADDEPQMTLRPQYPSWWRTRHASQIYDWEKLMLSTIDEGEHVYQFYEQAGNRHHRSIELYSLQAEARRAHTQIERALKLVMTHRLRTLEWYAEVLDMDVRRLSKGGSEHLLLQFMRKPSARSPALGVLQGNMRCRSPAREDGDSSINSVYKAARPV